MGEFYLSFNNKRVRVWFYTIVPGILLTVLLFFLLPREFYFIPTLLPIPITFYNVKEISISNSLISQLTVKKLGFFHFSIKAPDC